MRAEGSTTPRGTQEQELNTSTNAGLNTNTNQPDDDNYTEMLMNKAPIAIRKAKKLDFDDSDSDDNKWSDNETATKTQKPTPQPLKLEEKTQPQPVVTQNDEKIETSPRNFKFENAQKDYFGKNDLLGGDMTTSVTSIRGENKQPDALPKENPLDLLKNLNQPVETKPKAQPKKEEENYRKETFGGPLDGNNPLALLNGLKTMDKQHKKEKKAALFDDDDDDDGLFKKPPQRKTTGNLWGDEPTEQKKAPPKKTKLFEDSDDDNVGSFFKKSPPGQDIQKPSLAEPKKDTKAKRPLWDDSD